MQGELDKLRESELFRVRRAALVEVRDWWGNSVIDEAGVTSRSGEFISVPDEGQGYRLIGRLRCGQESRLLTHGAFSLLLIISQTWSDVVAKLGGGEKVWLSVTSLYRDSRTQQAFIASGFNAAEVSSHQAGMAIDFDPNGYYADEEREPVNRLNETFKEKYIGALLSVVEQLFIDGACNFVREKGFRNEGDRVVEYFSCYHVCVAPSYVALLKTPKGHDQRKI